jgi:3-oxoacyl-[acyl-carrier-protein] synthase II
MKYFLNRIYDKWRRKIGYLASGLEKRAGRRVVVTGLSAITSVGIGKDLFWEAVKAGRSGIRKITRFDLSDFPSQIGGEVLDFNPTKYLNTKDIHHMGRFSQFGVAVARMAIEDAKLKINNGNADRIGVAIGTSLGGLSYGEKELEIFLSRGYKKINPFTIAASIASNCPSLISIALNITGPSVIISTACASATDAIGYARDCIIKGEVDVMIAGGSEALLTPFTFGAFGVTGVLSKNNDMPEKACRPFDKMRDGQVLAEGAGVLVLEELTHALKRKTDIYAELIGYARTSDCIHPIIQEGSGKQAARAMRLALEDAGIKPNEVDYINAHGSSTIPNDRIETNVIKEVFGSYAYSIPVSSTKSMIGHLQGGCGGPEAVATVLAVKYDIIPPTINYEFRDPECDLDYVPNVARKKQVKVALKNSFGFGGKNSVLVFKKY